MKLRWEIPHDVLSFAEKVQLALYAYACVGRFLLGLSWWRDHFFSRWCVRPWAAECASGHHLVRTRPSHGRPDERERTAVKRSIPPLASVRPSVRARPSNHAPPRLSCREPTQWRGNNGKSRKSTFWLRSKPSEHHLSLRPPVGKLEEVLLRARWTMNERTNANERKWLKTRRRSSFARQIKSRDFI